MTGPLKVRLIEKLSENRKPLEEREYYTGHKNNAFIVTTKHIQNAQFFPPGTPFIEDRLAESLEGEFRVVTLTEQPGSVAALRAALENLMSWVENDLFIISPEATADDDRGIHIAIKVADEALAAAGRDQSDTRYCGSCGKALSNDCPQCQKLWES